MIYLLNLVFQSDLDLNVERQTVGFLRVSAENRRAPRQARICATHALSAAEHVSPLCGRAPGRTQGKGLLVPGPILYDGFRPTALSGGGRCRHGAGQACRRNNRQAGAACFLRRLFGPLSGPGRSPVGGCLEPAIRHGWVNSIFPRKSPISPGPPPAPPSAPATTSIPAPSAAPDGFPPEPPCPASVSALRHLMPAVPGSPA